MSTENGSPPVDLISLAVRFLNAMLDSADVEVIGTANWWDRARTALETGAATGTAFSEVVSKTADKLQITGAFSASTSEEINQLTAELADPNVFDAWRAWCQDNAVYATAITRVHRQARRKAAS